MPRRIIEEMLSHAVAEQPLECCGLLAGLVLGLRRETGNELGDEVRLAHVVRRYPLVNDVRALRESHSDPEREFLSEPRSMFEAVRDMRQVGLDILAVYHSHPTSQPVPSQKDLERNYSPDVVNFIISLQTEPPRLRAWWLQLEKRNTDHATQIW